MKKHIYKLVAGVLLATTMLSVTACSTQSNQDQTQTNKDMPMGRYVEETLSLPSDFKFVIDSHVYDNGTIQMIGQTDQGLKSYELVEGNEWKEQSLEWLKILEEQKNQILSFGYGTEAILYVSYIDQNYTSQVAKIETDGTLNILPIEALAKDGKTQMQSMFIDAMTVLENDQLLLTARGRKTMKVDANTGKTLVEYVGAGESVVALSNQLAILDSQKGGVVLYDLTTGEELKVIPCDGTIWEAKLLKGKDDSLYLMNEQGISRLAPGGSVWENIVEGNRTSFGMPSYYISNGAVLDETTFLTVFNDVTDGTQLIKYSYDENMPARPTTEVSLYMLYDNMTIRQAVAEYQRQNPDIMINMQIGIQEGDSIIPSDAIRTLNTQLLAGKGPDLLVLDGLPINSYIEKGVLLDMSDFASNMLESDEWLTNILGGYKNEDGSIYTLPTKFTLPTLWGNKTILNQVKSMEDLEQYAKSNKEDQLFIDMTPEDLIRKFYGVSAHTWLDEKGYIKEDAFESFLEAIQSIVTTKDADKWKEDIKGFIEQEYLAYDDTQLLTYDVQDILEIDGLYSAIVQKGNSDFDLVFGEEVGIFNPKGLIGINATSQHQDIAKDIVTLALSKDVQQVKLPREGLSVHREVIQKETTLDTSKSIMMMAVAMERPIERTEVTQDVYNQFLSLIEKAHTPAYEDEVLLELILKETKGYFDGEDTAQEAARKTAQRTKAYLSE